MPIWEYRTYVGTVGIQVLVLEPGGHLPESTGTYKGWFMQVQSNYVGTRTKLLDGTKDTLPTYLTSLLYAESL